MCVLLLIPANSLLSKNETQQTSQQPAPAQAPTAAKIPADQLDALVSPIALYPDPMLSQTLVASTYPLELMQLQQWLARNKGLSDKAVKDAVSKQPWDPSIQAMAGLPDLVTRLANDIQWTTDLGNAFLAQQSDVMDAVQRMRAKAQNNGALTSNDHQTVETQMIEDKTVIVVEQASPETVYVPSYNPEAVYGPAEYPYPPIYYPSYDAGDVFAASAISWGVGVAMGAFWGGGGWGWGAGWGGNDIDINVDNEFNRADFERNRVDHREGDRNVNRGDRAGNRGDRNWQHNPQHRGGAPYGDRATADRFGSNARGDSLANRQRGAQQQINRSGGNLGSVRDRPGNVGNIGGGDRNFGAGNRPSTGNISNRAKPAGGGSFGGGSHVGNRNIGSSSSRGGFGSGSGYSGSAARSHSSRGSSSFSGSRGSYGGGSRGGGSRGGGGRGGGGRGGGRR
jgi:hypothetical protein